MVRGSISGKSEIFRPSKPALGPTQPPDKGYRDSSPGVKRPLRGVDQPLLSSTLVQTGQSYTLCLHRHVTGWTSKCLHFLLHFPAALLSKDCLLGYYAMYKQFVPTLRRTCCLHLQSGWIMFRWMLKRLRTLTNQQDPRRERRLRHRHESAPW
jgi:hypothetical protein